MKSSWYEKCAQYTQKVTIVALILGVTFISCKDSSVSGVDIEDEELALTMTAIDKSSGKAVISQNSVSSGTLIDDFNGPTGSWAGDFPNKFTYQEDATILGGARELRSYRWGVTRIDGSAGTLEWGGTNTSMEYSLDYGRFIGTGGSHTKGGSPNGGKGVDLNLNIGLGGAIILNVLNVSQSNSNINVFVTSTDGGWFYYTTVTLTVGEVRIPLSDFVAFQYGTPIPEEAAVDIDGFRFDGFAHNDQGSAGTGTVFAKISYETGTTSNVYVSGDQVDTYDHINAPTVSDWTTSVCYDGGSIGLDDPRWTRTENQKAFNIRPLLGSSGLHPFEYWWNGIHSPENFGEADWINSAYTNSSLGMNPDGAGHNWTRYEVPVDGNGTFKVSLLADNCSWIYLDDEIIGYQDEAGLNDPNTPISYGVTLDGPAILTFIIYDGGGAPGGKFRLETTTEDIPEYEPPTPVNNAPIADAGVDQSVTATGQTTSVTLDGTGSSDADGDNLTYNWSNGATGATPTIQLADGVHVLTLTVSDGEASDTDEVTITVVNTIPEVDAGTDQTIEATGFTTPVRLSATASDADGDELTLEWSTGETSGSIAPHLEVGVYTFTVTVTDTEGATASDEVTVTIVDTTSPEITFNQETGQLWPPNHKMVLVATGISASDIVDDNVNVSISVTSSESDNGTGDGNTNGDYEIVENFDGTFDIYLRAERSGKNNGRTYTVTVTAIDFAGNSSSTSFTASVEHDQGGNSSKPSSKSGKKGKG